MTISLSYTDHALLRMQQRGISLSDVELVVVAGQRIWCAGALHCFLGRRQLSRTTQPKARDLRLEGITVLLDSHDQCSVITVYRNRDGLRPIKRKAKFNRKLVRTHD